MSMQLVIEAVVVGATLAVALAAAFAVHRPTSTTDVLLTGFVLGVLIHLGFEAFGFNRAYCTIGAACRKA